VRPERKEIAVTRVLQISVVFLVALVLGGATTQAQRGGYESFFVFGDSLSDTGNVWILTKTLGANPAIPPSEDPHRTYFFGRFSNGPVAFEYLWGRLGSQRPLIPPFLGRWRLPESGAVSFAFGASGSEDFTEIGGFPLPGLGAQIELFRWALLGKHPPRRALYAVFTGANDYVVDPGAQPADPADVVENIARGIQRLYLLGARHIIVPNLPDLGLLPIAGAASPLLSQLTAEHNQRLAWRLKLLSSQLPGLRIIEIDLPLALASLPPSLDLTTPALDALFPIPPNGVPASLCIFVNPSACPNVANFAVGPRHFFWDAQHPSTAAHAAVANYLHGVVRAQSYGNP
jgi:phospholipase/lecithinase/hemolysin